MFTVKCQTCKKVNTTQEHRCVYDKEIYPRCRICRNNNITISKKENFPRRILTSGQLSIFAFLLSTSLIHCRISADFRDNIY